MKHSIPLHWRRIPHRYKLEGNMCKNCNSHYFPPRPICPKCRRQGKLEKYKFSGLGTVVSYTKVFVPPAGFEELAPYYIAIIKLDEGCCVTAQIVDSDNVEIGDRVKAVFRKIQEDGEHGVIHYGFKFKVIGKNQ
jgi:uncharacterized OB-fold protein